MKSIYEILAAKRDGRPLAPAEIRHLVELYTAGTLEDYQMSAFLMAAFVRGLDASETAALTGAMLDSGETVTVPGLDRPLIDKHSTGGVGDKLSLTLSPLLAECGIAVGMFSGRGLGHTGGTLDKLEAIPGMRVFHTASEFAKLLKRHHWAITGQTTRIAPADKRIYALRDATGTVESIPLIVASIMSKKLALKSDGIVFDVKFGSGAFMKSISDARKLAKSLLYVSKAHRMPARAILTTMNQPTGRMVGNLLEVLESIEVLRGGGPADTVNLTLEIGAEMLLVARQTRTRSDALNSLKRALQSGAAYENWCRYITACGGDLKPLDRPERMMKSVHKEIVKSTQSGYIGAIDTGRLGFLTVRLGAGRQTVSDKVDHLAGAELFVKIGSEVKRGDALACGYARQKSRLAGFRKELAACFTIVSEMPKPDRLVLQRL